MSQSHVSFPLLSSYQRISRGSRHFHLFRNKASFYGKELFAPRPTPTLEDRPLSAVRDCLFNIFAATLHNGRRYSTRNLRTRQPCDRDPTYHVIATLRKKLFQFFVQIVHPLKHCLSTTIRHLCSTSRQFGWDLWWAKCRCAGFPPRASPFLCHHHSINVLYSCFVLLLPTLCNTSNWQRS